MTQYMFHPITIPEYCGIITILDYEIHLSSCLYRVVLPSEFQHKKVIVDLALKSGIDEYRFVVFNVNENGKIVLNNHSYITASKEIEKVANGFLQQQKDIVNNSFLTDAQKKAILS